MRVRRLLAPVAVFVAAGAVLWPLSGTGFVEAFALFLLCVVVLFGVFTVAAEAQAEAVDRAEAEAALERGRVS